MEETEVLDFDKICRLCLMEKGSMLRIFAKKKRNNTTPLPIRIMSCTSLEYNWFLPHHISEAKKPVLFVCGSTIVQKQGTCRPIHCIPIFGFKKSCESVCAKPLEQHQMIAQGDGLPAKICPKCLWDVNQAYTFRERCEAANERLHHYVHRIKNQVPQQISQNLDEQNESNPLEFLHEKIAIMEKNSLVEVKSENEGQDDDLPPINGDEDEDDKPISSLIGCVRAAREAGKPYNTSNADEVKEEIDESRDCAGQDIDSDCVADVGDSESDLDTEPAAALVETEMREDEKTSELGDQSVLNAQRPMNVREYLETEFASESNFEAHKKFYLVGTEFSKMKKKQKSVPDKSNLRSGRLGRDGWEPFNIVDMKPRRKYAPREKNLISNNSSAIIEQDGTKSKFRACTHCGKVVLGKNMGIHVKIHVGNKSHLCDICGKSFLYKKTLETHKRVHSGERPCVCKICDKTFRSSSRLSDHMSTHTGRKPFICEICAVAFRIKGHLKKHLRVHSGEKPYICTFCEKAFSDAWNMKCHLRIHTGEKPPHACPVCGQCFLRRNKMEEHCKLTHGEEYVLPRKQNIVQRLKNDLVEMNEELRAISEREREDMLRQEAERQLLANHFETQRQELADHLGIPVTMPIPLPVPAFPGNIPAGIFGLQ